VFARRISNATICELAEKIRVTMGGEDPGGDEMLRCFGKA